MIKYLGAGLTILIGLSTTVFSYDTEEDVIWTNFNGTVPENALDAGIDGRGDIYIGATTFQGMVIPGKLYDGDKHIYFEYGEKGRKKAKQIKILCTNHPENFQWILTKHTDYKSIKNVPLVVGGYQPEFKTYIGKTILKNDEVDVGKIVCKEHMCFALYTWHKDGHKEYHSYYVLAHRDTQPSVY